MNDVKDRAELKLQVLAQAVLIIKNKIGGYAAVLYAFAAVKDEASIQAFIDTLSSDQAKVALAQYRELTNFIGTEEFKNKVFEDVMKSLGE